jgi:hypothetical protein
MAMELWDRGAFEQATTQMVWTCYFRLNGPSDMHPQEVDMTSVYKPFKPKAEFDQVSGELQVIRRSFEELGVSVDEGLEKFGTRAEREGQTMHLPLSWSSAKSLMHSWLANLPS